MNVRQLNMLLTQMIANGQGELRVVFYEEREGGWQGHSVITQVHKVHRTEQPTGWDDIGAAVVRYADLVVELGPDDTDVADRLPRDDAGPLRPAER